MTDRQITFLRVVKKKMREAKIIDQNDLARRMGIPHYSLSRYLSGKRKPDIDTIVRMAKALHCTTDELLIFDDETIKWALNLHKDTQK